jgi:hypothetical protein
MRDPVDLQVSPDGEHTYVAAFFSSGIAVFDRDPARRQGPGRIPTARELCLPNGTSRPQRRC